MKDATSRLGLIQVVGVLTLITLGAMVCPASASTGLTEQELAAVLTQAANAQSALRNVTAEFRLRVVDYRPPWDMTASGAPPVDPSAAAEPETIDGKMSWYRAEGFERFDLSFDLPDERQMHLYTDAIRIWRGAENRERIILTRTNQVAITESSHLTGWGPGNWLLGMDAQSVISMVAGSAPGEVSAERIGNTRDVRVTVQCDRGRTCELTLSAEADYAITSGKSGGPISWEIEYKRDSAGRVIPNSAVRTLTRSDGALIRVERLDAVRLSTDAPPPHVFEYLPRRAVVADNVTKTSYSVRDDGTLVPLRATVSGQSAASRPWIQLNGIVLIATLGVLALRLRFSRAV